MEFLGIGPLELIVILIIALTVVGPERLPEIARSIGKTLRDLRAMSQGLTAEWQQELNLATEIGDSKKGLQQALIEPFKEAQADFQRALSAPLKEAQTDLQKALTAPLASSPGDTVEPSSPEIPMEQPPVVEKSTTLNDNTAHANA